MTQEQKDYLVKLSHYPSYQQDKRFFESFGLGDLLTAYRESQDEIDRLNRALAKTDDGSGFQCNHGTNSHDNKGLGFQGILP